MRPVPFHRGSRVCLSRSPETSTRNCRSTTSTHSIDRYSKKTAQSSNCNALKISPSIAAPRRRFWLTVLRVPIGGHWRTLDSVTRTRAEGLSGERTMNIWECVICGFRYDESLGLPEAGIAAGTKWEDVPDDWLCPDCGTGKQDFDMQVVNA